VQVTKRAVNDKVTAFEPASSSTPPLPFTSELQTSLTAVSGSAALNMKKKTLVLTVALLVKTASTLVTIVVDVTSNNSPVQNPAGVASAAIS